LAAVILREPISRAKLGAVALAFVGALVVVTYDPQHAFWKTLTERFALLAGG
jgi:drug/metabolite transporter (DMT)-like permease